MNSIHYTVYSFNYTLYSIQYTVYNTYYTVYSIQHTVYSIQYTVYSIQYTVFSLQYTIYIVASTSGFARACFFYLRLKKKKIVCWGGGRPMRDRNLIMSVIHNDTPYFSIALIPGTFVRDLCQVAWSAC